MIPKNKSKIFYIEFKLNYAIFHSPKKPIFYNMNNVFLNATNTLTRGVNCTVTTIILTLF